MKTYMFAPKPSRFDLKNNPLSSIRGTKRNAEHWARYLLAWNSDAKSVEFMTEGGRKVYEIKRATAK